MSEQNASSPLIRAWLLGEFQVERRKEDGTWERVDKAKWEKSYARLLFKRLLCSSGRRAQRSTLIDDLWPDTSELVERYVNDAVYSLRKVFRPVEVVKTLGNGSGYELEDQSLLWTDVDACEALLREVEKLGRSSALAVPLLEQAKEYLRRGDFLEGEAAWWVHARRGTLERVRYRCLLWLAEAYEHQGMVGQAEIQYGHMLEDDPTDEEVLCRLMSLLHRHGMTKQALRCYENARQQTKQAGVQLSIATDAFAKCLLNEPRQVEKYLTDDRPKLPSSNEKEGQIVQPLEIRDKDMDPLRRATIAGLLGLTGITSVPLELWEQIAHSEPPMMKETDFDYFQQLIERSWGLCNVGEWAIAEHVLDSFLPSMIRNAPKQRAQTLLAARGLVLLSILRAHQLRLATMVPLCQQAVVYAKEIEEHTTLCMALNGLAVAFKYNQQFEDSFNTYLEALGSCDQASPLVRSRIYAGVAAAFAREGRKQEADLYINLAYEHFPDHPEYEPYFLSADNGLYMLSYYQGIMYLALNQPQEALTVFSSYKKHLSVHSIPRRNQLEIINHAGKAAILSNNLESYAQYLEEGIIGALELKSRKRLEEAVNTFREDMPKTWSGNQPIKLLTDQYPFLLEAK